MMKFEPNIPHNPYYIYKWKFSDGTTSTSREVYKSNYSGLTGTLTIFYAGRPGNCCESTKKVYVKHKELKKAIDKHFKVDTKKLASDV